MTTLVVDSSIVLKWIADEDDSDRARQLRQHELVAPPLLFLEIINVAARSWGWDEEALVELVSLVESVGVRVEAPSLGAVAHWAAAGLSAYDAAYVALAEEVSAPLITADGEILRVAADLAQPLSG